MIKPLESKEKYVLYVWLLKGDNYYIGQSLDFERRKWEHLSGDGGAKWTKKHKPIVIIDIQKFYATKDEILDEENKLTKRYIEEKGWKKVRGGDYCYVDKGRQWAELMIHNILRKQCYYLYKILLKDDCYYIGAANSYKNLRKAYITNRPWVKEHLQIKFDELYRIEDTIDIKVINDYINCLTLKTIRKCGCEKVRSTILYNLDKTEHEKEVRKKQKEKDYYREIEKKLINKVDDEEMIMIQADVDRLINERECFINRVNGITGSTS